MRILKTSVPHITEICSALMVKFEDIKVGEVIGRGTFGTVNHGKWKGKDVALKRMKTAGCCEYTRGCFQLQGDICTQVSVVISTQLVHYTFKAKLQAAGTPKHRLIVGILCD